MCEKENGRTRKKFLKYYFFSIVFNANFNTFRYYSLLFINSKYYLTTERILSIENFTFNFFLTFYFLNRDELYSKFYFVEKYLDFLFTLQNMKFEIHTNWSLIGIIKFYLFLIKCLTCLMNHLTKINHLFKVNMI